MRPIMGVIAMRIGGEEVLIVSCELRGLGRALRIVGFAGRSSVWQGVLEELKA